jgi:hypothetical protein
MVAERVSHARPVARSAFQLAFSMARLLVKRGMLSARCWSARVSGRATCNRVRKGAVLVLADHFMPQRQGRGAMSLREFAKRVRCNESTVRRGIESGRLELSVGYANGRPFIADVELAEQEWVGNKAK